MRRDVGPKEGEGQIPFFDGRALALPSKPATVSLLSSIMPHRARLTVRHAHFGSKDEVLAEIARDDLWPTTRHQGAFTPAPVHCHAAPVRIYVLAGSLFLDDGSDQELAQVNAGARIDIPAGAAHTVSASAMVTTITAFASAEDTSGLPQLPVNPGA